MLAAEKLAASTIQPDLLVPIPLTLPRYLIRSYNQSRLIADVISQICAIPVYSPLSRRFTLRHQAMLNRQSRHRGLLKEFNVTKDVQHKNILLIDDVLTTGATLSAAAQVLLDAGAAEVNVLVLARSISYSGKTRSALPFHDVPL
jgi:ComF family protein